MKCLALILLGVCIGCGNKPFTGQRLVILVPGAGGDGPWYQGLRQAIRSADQTVTVQTFSWGMPQPLWVMNLQDRGVHQRAEEALAGRLADWRRIHPQGRVSLIGHSAGCGVILGALGKLDQGNDVKRLLLLAPSVSPQYDLRLALARTGGIHVFHSSRDTLWLRWRTSTFGTYDNIKTPAAGFAGFAPQGLSPQLEAKIVQHTYLDPWKELGNDGSHDGWLSRRFAYEILAPLIFPADSPSPTTRP